MYLSELRLWNFRKYGSINDGPGLIVPFNNGLNLLVGENDSGKSAIIDAIKYILGTQSNDFQRISEKDFYKPVGGKRTTELKIECIFKDFSPMEAGNFIEWLNFDEEDKYELQIRLKAKFVGNRITVDIRAGIEGADIQLDGAARELLRTTYLKPLRDAEHELTPGYRSRLAQILKSHDLFQVKEDDNHPLVYFFKKANEQINDYFSKDKIIIEDSNEQQVITSTGSKISVTLNQFLKEFFPEGEQSKAVFSISDVELTDVLKKLSLIIDDNTSGLGSLNLLFIATELLLLQDNSMNGLKLALIEEIEAHLHPQAQLRLIDFLQNIKTKGQFILTTHSTTLASSINLKNLIICRDNQVYPMGPEYTQLAEDDYSFLERFLDATKSNLFFARGVMLVEGDAENLLLPTIAKIIEKPLHKYGISIVNVGSTAFLRYAKIFMRKDEKKMNIPVAIITDLDVRPIEYYNDKELTTDIFCITDSNIDQFKELSQDIEFHKIKNVVFESKTSFEEAIRSVNKKGRLPNGFKDQYEKFSKFKLGPDFIEMLKTKKYKKKEGSLSEDNVKVFVSSNWTLEYDFALSELKDYILGSILSAKIEANKGVVVNDDIFDDLIEDEIKNLKTYWSQQRYSDEKVAYEIYKYLLNGQASKAITAQYFAQKLVKEKVDKSKLISDPNIKYLAQAIEYVTKGE
ncbi:AAA family ATPase [Fredinandcohnia sp. QZ13]|uniref:ATP-dependent nuclease n=1 Tax=Fredinandcohnia sp. QZ13 TaxID=3073144 RepID=UPI00285360AF|nr:AAA family ATPase [Fredinandcohnia sp. QZ13]MDR4887544.1 AAA family ATPase [Fredinandcohnia sp. QZ13]